MAKIKETVSSLPFGMAELTTQAMRILNALNRDLTELSTLGITSEKIAEFKNQINNLVTMKKDQDFRASMYLLALSKKQKLKELIFSLRMLELTIKMNLGSTYDCEALINIKALRSFSGKQIVAKLGTVFSALKSSELLYNSDLCIKNAIDRAESAFIAFSEAYSNSIHLSLSRRKTTDNRLPEAYKLYSQVQSFCYIGRNFWKIKSSHRAMDYKMHYNRKATRNKNQNQGKESLSQSFMAG